MQNWRINIMFYIWDEMFWFWGWFWMFGMEFIDVNFLYDDGSCFKCWFVLVFVPICLLEKLLLLLLFDRLLLAGVNCCWLQLLPFDINLLVLSLFEFVLTISGVVGSTIFSNGFWPHISNNYAQPILYSSL